MHLTREVRFLRRSGDSQLSGETLHLPLTGCSPHARLITCFHRTHRPQWNVGEWEEALA
jgi:hypothetical protein